MSDQIAFLFPGQGAQTVGMGKDFHDNFLEAREIFQHADDILRRSLSKIIFEGPMEALTETRNSQLAIFITSYAILCVLEKQFPQLKPSVCAGLSLGEYTALCAGGWLDFETCLSVIQFRGEEMNKACEMSQGAMAALFGLSSDAVDHLVSSLQLPQDLWVANYNCPGQVVISGTVKGVEKGIEEAKKMGAKRAIPLKVHGAFHSGLMLPAKSNLEALLKKIEFKQSPVALVMNVPGNYVRVKEEIRSYLMQQLTASVRWEQGIRAMMPHTRLFVEIGCGKVLTGLNKQTGVTAPTITINQPSDLEQLAAF